MTSSLSPPLRRRRRWPRVLALLLGLALLLAAGLLLAALALLPSATPTVSASGELAVADVERALRLAKVHDPRRAIPGVVRTLRLSRHEAELLINHAAARLRPGRWALELGLEQARLQGSVALPPNPLGAWLNVEIRLSATSGLPQLERVRLGRLALSPALVQAVLAWQAGRHGIAVGDAGNAAGLAAVLGLQQVRLGPQHLDLVYAWGQDAPARMLGALLPPQEQERLRVHAERLAAIAVALPPGRPVALSQLLPPMFELARQRSAAGQDAAAENRAALLVLGLAANGVGLAVLLPERRAELQAHPIELTLAGRRDSPQHFLVSATLAADAGGPLADLIGLYKEIADSRGGSGFSFNDLAANRAGTRLGERAVGTPERLQALLARPLEEQDLLPDVSDLPEALQERDFRRRFGGPGSPAYERLLSDIEERLDATPLYR